MKSVDGVLHLSQIFGISQSEPGNLVVEFIFSIVWQLLDASLGDEGLLEFTPDKKCKWAMIYQEMELDGHNDYTDTEQKERLRNTNTLIAIELIGRFLQDKISSRILCLARQNLYVSVIRYIYIYLSHLLKLIRFWNFLSIQFGI